MTIKYELKFFDYWHLSSGLSAGAKLDSTVVKDENDLPYASGKTIKGLVREMAEKFDDCNFVNSCFGYSSDKEDKCFEKEPKEKKTLCYFSNATLNEDVQKEICTNNLQDNLYDVIASTKIGQKDVKNEKEGIAVTNSLREIEVVVPVCLYGEIRDIPDAFGENIKKSLKLIKRMGLNRNRGLGRCEFKIVEERA